MAEEPHGIAFATQDGGDRRSTSAAGRQIVADALRAVDPVGSRAAEHETAWRSQYLNHFRRGVEAGLGNRDDWLRIARDGLASVDAHMAFLDDNGREAPATALLDAKAARGLQTWEIQGERPPVTSVEVPYRGRTLRGDELLGQLALWTAHGTMEPSAAEAIGWVVENPDWLSLPGRTVTVLGAGAEMGPLRALLRWGATVAAVDLPRPAIWKRVVAAAQEGAGRLLVPVAADATATGDTAAAGADLLAEVPAVAEWLAGLGGGLVVGNYLYADGAAHVRLSVAADLLGRRLRRQREDVSLAFLATPTDVFAVPADAVQHSAAAYAQRSRFGKVVGRPARWVSRGRLLQRAYRPDADPGIADALVPQQGPNYALAKRIQRWRAALARDEGVTVSFHVAPSSRTRSVVKNPALAAAFNGAHRFGVEVFDPQTANVLMAALLVHDLCVGTPTHSHPWQDEAYAAVHGGLWRSAYQPRSALGLAAVLGYATSRS